MLSIILFQIKKNVRLFCAPAALVLFYPFCRLLLCKAWCSVLIKQGCCFANVLLFSYRENRRLGRGRPAGRQASCSASSHDRVRARSSCICLFLEGTNSNNIQQEGCRNILQDLLGNSRWIYEQIQIVFRTYVLYFTFTRLDMATYCYFIHQASRHIKASYSNQSMKDYCTYNSTSSTVVLIVVLW